MKRRYLILPISILALILVFTLLPVSFISANPGNLVENGDFSDGTNHWVFSNAILSGGQALVGPVDGANILQFPITSSDKTLTYRVDVKPVTYGSGGYFACAVQLWNGASYVTRGVTFMTPAVDVITHINFKFEDHWGPLSDFDTIGVLLTTYDGCQVYCDNFILEDTVDNGGNDEEEVEEEIWVRNHEMQCWQVWINQDNAFEFVFVWEYANNNHVQIFDMAGNLVFETDMQKGNAHFVAPLPDGMYTVKTFHEAGHILQEFIIGKP